MVPNTLQTKLQQKEEHVRAVQQIAGELCDMLRVQTRNHDADKIDDLKRAIVSDVDPKSYHKDMEHYSKSRHHWWATHPDDVNLIDIMEAIADMVAVARVRDGICEIPLAPPLYKSSGFRKVIENTIHQVDKSVKVKFFDATTYEF